MAPRPRRSVRLGLGGWGLGLRRRALLVGAFGQRAREGRSSGRAAAPPLGAGLGEDERDPRLLRPRRPGRG